MKKYCFFLTLYLWALSLSDNAIVGNNKKMTMDVNPTQLKMVGNNCIVRISVNQGEIEAIGNNCRIEVSENDGVINQFGGNGNVIVTKNWKGYSVQLLGPNRHLVKKYWIVGNNNKVTMDVNPTQLKVDGNNCVVSVSVNQGEIEVIGNNCQIEVSENYGVINLVGNNGNVIVTKSYCVQLLGPNCHLVTKYSIVGNNNEVTVDVNPTQLKVVGNNCIVRVSVNQGEIEVIQNNCRIEVSDNYGVIKLVGANGYVSVTKRWKGDSVQLLGSNCQLVVAGKEKTCGYEAQLSPFSKDLDDVILSESHL